VSKNLIYFLISSFCLGIFIRNQVNLGWSFLILIIIVSLNLFHGLGGIQRRDKINFKLQDIRDSGPSPGRQKRTEVFCLIIIFFFLGYLRLHISLNNIENYFFVYENFIGTVIEEPDVRENYTHYVILVSLPAEDGEKNFKSRITLGHYPILKYGDVIKLEGKFEKPKNFKNENDIEFDYINFLLKDDIQYISYYPKVEIIDHNGNFFKENLLVFKYWFVNNLERSVRAPHSALAAGILVGSKQALGKELLEDFRKVGLIHIVVLSGYNVTVVINAIQKFFTILPIPRNFSFLFSFISIISFAILTGASATTVRASIMASLVVFSEFIRRDYDVNRALFLAGFLMVLHNPRILMSDPGFQLSFVATLGLLHLSPQIEKVLPSPGLRQGGNILEKLEIRQIISATISTQISVLPLLINMTGEISLIALIANLLVLPIIPISMLFSFLSGLTNFLGIISLTFSLPTYFLLEYVLVITKFLAKLPFSTISLN
jgi:competence protein ComEC